jgi:hypothetical protein
MFDDDVELRNQSSNGKVYEKVAPGHVGESP